MTAKQVEDYLEDMRKKLFDVKSYEELANQHQVEVESDQLASVRTQSTVAAEPQTNIQQLQAQQDLLQR